MPKIEIKEIDKTTPGVVASSNEVVYIPGFVDIDTNFADGTKTPIDVNVPTLFSSLSAFESKCGAAGFIFTEDQMYDSLTSKFANTAIPAGGVLIAKGTTDPSYVMAKELLAAGLSVVYERINATNADIKIDTMYKAFATIYGVGDYGLADVGNYSIKYLTAGGYPVYEYNSGSVVTAMLALAAKRGDCVALIDHTHNVDREQDITQEDSIFMTVNADTSLQTNGEYAAMFTPWCGYNRTTSDVNGSGVIHSVVDPSNDTVTLKAQQADVLLPASYSYLAALADSIQTNASWLAVAGVARGLVPNLSSNGIKTDIPNGVADSMQPRSAADGSGIAINAITNIKPYGQTIWGNRTLKKNTENLVATSFLNIRNLVCDVKKVAYTAARSLTFEQNTDILWVNFKSKIAPTLDRMQSGYGISGYKILRDTEHEKAAEKATVCAKIILYPVYAVEDFYITVVLSDDEVTVE